MSPALQISSFGADVLGATHEDLMVLQPAALNVPGYAEELEEDPRRADALAYARRVEEECRDGWTWVWRDGRGLCFRAGISALTAEAAQVSGVYVPPSLRGQRIASQALAELCARLLQRSRTVCLFVNDFNAPALALYRRMGFVATADWASAFYDSGV